jgi:MFS family permease
MVIGLMAGTVAVLPAIGTAARATQSDLQWIADAFPVILAALLLPAGALLDRHGRRRGMLVGLTILLVSMVALAAADSVGQVLAARCAAGVGSALVFPGTLATITAVLPDERRSRAVSMWAFSLIVGAMSGLLLCAAVTQIASWHAAFLGLGAIIAVLLVLVAAVIPETRATEGVVLDPIGAVASIVAIGLLTLAVSQGPIHGWTGFATLGPAVLGALALAGFVTWELRVPDPMPDVRVFADGGVCAAATALFVIFLAHFGLFFLIFQYESYVLGYNSLEAALGMVPPSVGILLTPVSLHLGHRYGRRLIMATGLLVAAVGAAVAASIAATGAAGYATFALGAFIIWAGMGLAMAPPTELIIEAIPAAKQGVASAVNDLARGLGAAFGIAISGSVFNGAYRAFIADHSTGLPATTAHAVSESPAIGLHALVASPSPGTSTDLVIEGVLHGWQWSLTVLAVVLLIGAAIVAWRGPPPTAAPRIDGPSAFGCAQRLNRRPTPRWDLSIARAVSRPGQPLVPDIGWVPWPDRQRPSISGVS